MSRFLYGQVLSAHKSGAWGNIWHWNHGKDKSEAYLVGIDGGKKQKSIFILLLEWKRKSRSFSYLRYERLIYYICNLRKYPEYHEKGGIK